MRLAASRIAAAAVVFLLTGHVAAFTFSSSRIRRGGYWYGGAAAAMSQSSDDDSNDGSDANEGHAMQPFFEETALKGSDAVRAMSIEERTRRAMLAEAVEDRVCILYDDLEEILGPEGILPESEEKREEVTTIAKQIKVLQNDYKQLVSGERSAYLEGFDFKK